MNIPQLIINDRSIISLDIYKYHQSLAKKLTQKRKYFENNISKPIISKYDKEKIFTWFADLNIQERVKVCSIYNNWLTKIIFQLMIYTKYDSVVEFCPTQFFDEFFKNKNKNNIFLKDFESEYHEVMKDKFKTIKSFDDFFIFFKGENNIKKSSGTPSSAELKYIDSKKFRENEFMKEIRFLSLSEFNDTLTLSLELINNPLKMMEYFNYFSNGQCFHSEINPIKEENKSYNFSFPNWIYEYNSYSIYQLLIIFFEQIISIYYQIYLEEKQIPQFEIDKKINELFQTNLEIEDYLSKEYLRKENYNFSFIDKEKIFNELNNEKQKYLISYYENKTELVYSYAFASKYDGNTYNNSFQKIGFMNNKIRQLINLCNLDIKAFINKISFIESNEAFLIPNFIYSILYHQLIEQRLNQFCQELLIEDQQKMNNKPNKNIKNKKRKNKKKKKNFNKQIINENNINNENQDYKRVNLEEEEVNKKNNNETEEEIEEIPSDIIILQKNELNEGESNNINSNNEFNNSTVSSSYTNKCSKGLYSLGPKYNNFFIGDKKEEERLIKIEMEDLSEDKSEDNIKEEKEENEKFKLEDISENDISEETLFNEDKHINKNIEKEDLCKKKKKNNKKRNRKKNKKTIKDIYNNEEMLDNEKKEKIIGAKNINLDNKNKHMNEESTHLEIKIKAIENEIKKNKEEKNEVLSQKIEDKQNKFNVEKENIEKTINNKIKVLNNSSNENKIDSNDEENNRKQKRKKKEFFLFPVYNSNKKKVNNKNKGKNNKNEIYYCVKDKSNNISNEKEDSIYNYDIKDINKKDKNDNNTNIIEEPNKKKEINFQSEDFLYKKNKNILLQDKNNNNTNNIELIKSNESKIEILGNQNEKNLRVENKNANDKIDMHNLPLEGITNYEKNKFCHINIKTEFKNNNNNHYNKFYYINQPEYSNIFFFPNCNNSLYILQNELFNILNKEILDFQKTVDTNLNNIRIYREQMIKDIEQFISKVLNQYYDFEFYLYGSYSTGLSIEISDIDILIKFKIKEENDINNFNSRQNKQNIGHIISLIEKALNQNKDLLKIIQINPIYTATVPVLKIECSLKDLIPDNIQKELKKLYLFNFENEILKLNFDFTFHEVKNIKEKKLIPSQEIIIYIKDVIKEYPIIRPIFLILKRYIQIKKLNSSFHGGISSYSLFLLLYAYILKSFKKKEENEDSLTSNLGKTLLGFFSFYSNMNFELYSIDVNNNNIFNLLDKIYENGILLKDPITGLNVAKSTFQIEKIKYVFNNALFTLNNFFYKNMNSTNKDEKYNILRNFFNTFN